MILDIEPIQEEEDVGDFDIPPMPANKVIPLKVPKVSPNRARLEKDLKVCNNINSNCLKCKFIGDNQWDVLLTPIPGTVLDKSFQSFKRSNSYPDNGIHLCIVFPPDYPNQIPLIYNSKPNLQGGSIFSGAFCNSALSRSKWKPVFNVSQPLLAICDFLLYHSSISVSNGSHSFSEAVAQYGWIFGSAHTNWGLPDWIRNLK